MKLKGTGRGPLVLAREMDCNSLVVLVDFRVRMSKWTLDFKNDTDTVSGIYCSTGCIQELGVQGVLGHKL